MPGASVEWNLQHKRVKQKKCKTKLERTPKTEELFQMIGIKVS